MCVMEGLEKRYIESKTGNRKSLSFIVLEFFSSRQHRKLYDLTDGAELHD